MMTSSNGNNFRVTGPWWGEFIRSPVNSPHKGQWRGALMFSLISAWTKDWVNNRDAGDLRRHRAHYDVTVMNVGRVTNPLAPEGFRVECCTDTASSPSSSSSSGGTSLNFTSLATEAGRDSREEPQLLIGRSMKRPGGDKGGWWD